MDGPTLRACSSLVVLLMALWAPAAAFSIPATVLPMLPAARSAALSERVARFPNFLRSRSASFSTERNEPAKAAPIVTVTFAPPLDITHPHTA